MTQAETPLTARVLFIKPRKEPEVRTIKTHSPLVELKELSDLVGGYLEAAYITPDATVAMLFDEEGKLDHKRLPLNFAWAGEQIVGNVVVVRRNERGDVIDLTDDDIALFKEHMQR